MEYEKFLMGCIEAYNSFKSPESENYNSIQEVIYEEDLSKAYEENLDPYEFVENWMAVNGYLE